MKMANFRISKNTNDRTKPDGRCKRHPKHKQSPGACALCLRERLNQLLASNSHRSSTTTGSYCSSSSSLSSCYSSSSGSSCSSPVPGGYRFTLEGRGSISSLLTKSRSMAFVPKRRCAKSDKDKKKNGFWSKLISVHSKESLVHSRTVRERVTSYY